MALFDGVVVGVLVIILIALPVIVVVEKCEHKSKLAGASRRKYV